MGLVRTPGFHFRGRGFDSWLGGGGGQRFSAAKSLSQGGRSVCLGVTDLVITRRGILLAFGEQGLGIPVSPHNKELSHTPLECPTDIYIVKNLFIIT